MSPIKYSNGNVEITPTTHLVEFDEHGPIGGQSFPMPDGSILHLGEPIVVEEPDFEAVTRFFLKWEAPIKITMLTIATWLVSLVTHAGLSIFQCVGVAAIFYFFFQLISFYVVFEAYNTPEIFNYLIKKLDMPVHRISENRNPRSENTIPNDILKSPIINETNELLRSTAAVSMWVKFCSTVKMLTSFFSELGKVIHGTYLTISLLFATSQYWFPIVKSWALWVIHLWF
jgi:hypothetical protein